MIVPSIAKEHSIEVKQLCISSDFLTLNGRKSCTPDNEHQNQLPIQAFGGVAEN